MYVYIFLKKYISNDTRGINYSCRRNEDGKVKFDGTPARIKKKCSARQEKIRGKKRGKVSGIQSAVGIL